MEKLAIGLYSGGLDSILAVKLIVDQGFRVILLTYMSSFFEDRRTDGRVFDGILPSESFNIQEIAVGEDYLQMLRAPRYGYGKNLNPCLDCKVFMINKAGEIMRECDAAFVFTGEVLGQRPMSQRRDALRIVERDSGLDGYLLRPLSAQLLPPTIAEEKGLIRRDNLLDISGRSRKKQMELARSFHIAQYPNPSGGCLLTDINFAKRLKTVLNEEDNRITMEDIPLLKIGRHFLIRPKVRLVVGRNHSENQKILTLGKKNDWIFRVINAAGPVLLAQGELKDQDFYLAASVTARYSDANKHSDANKQENIPVGYGLNGSSCDRTIMVSSIEDHLLDRYRM